MSLIKQADVKNHLSARHRTEIHLEPVIHADATGFPHEDPASQDSDSENSVMNPPNIPTPSEPEIVPIVTAKSVRA